MICRRTVFAAAALLLALSSAPALGAQGDNEDILIELDAKVTDLRCADLSGDGLQDLVVLTQSDPPKPWKRGIAVYVQQKDGSFTAVHIPAEWTRESFLVDIGRFDREGGEEILIVSKEAVGVIGIRKGEPKRIVEGIPLSSLFQGGVHNDFYFLDCSLDLDGDGLDDAIVATDTEYVVLFDGLTRAVPIAEPVEKKIERFENSFFAVSVEAAKTRVLPFDGESPFIVLESGGQLIGRRYDRKTGSFVRMASTEKKYGSFSDEVKVGTLEYTGTMLGDFNRSGRPNLLLSERSGQIGILTKLKTKHTFFDIIEYPQKGELDFKPRQIIANAGICAKPTFSDLDVDGHDDLILRFVEASILAKFLEAMLDRVIITCQAFLFHPEKGTYSFEPDWSREVPVPSDCFETVGIEGLTMMDSDFTGDGQPDLVIYESDRLNFFRGERDEGFFSTTEVSFVSRPFYQVAGPFPGPLTVVDLDGDGRKEIITAGDTIVRVIHVQ